MDESKAGGRPGWVCLDTETTGLKAGEDELLQLAITDWGGRPLYLSYFRPERHAEWPEAAKVSGITPETVAAAPPLSDEAPAIQAVIDAAEVVCIYNAEFDAAFLEAAGIDLSGKAVADAMTGFAEAYGEWSERRGTWRCKKLGFAAAHVGYGDYPAHDALEDCRATIAVQDWLDGRRPGRRAADDEGRLEGAVMYEIELMGNAEGIGTRIYSRDLPSTEGALMHARG